MHIPSFLSYCSVMKGSPREHLLRWVLLWVFDQVLIPPSNNSHLWLVVQDLCLLWVVQVDLGEEILLGETLMGPTTSAVDTRLLFSLIMVNSTSLWSKTSCLWILLIPVSFSVTLLSGNHWCWPLSLVSHRDIAWTRFDHEIITRLSFEP